MQQALVDQSSVTWLHHMEQKDAQMHDVKDAASVHANWRERRRHKWLIYLQRRQPPDNEMLGVRGRREDGRGRDH